MNMSPLEKILKTVFFCIKESITIKSRKYYIREILGEGGFSTVYLAEDSVSRRYYAIKKIMCHSAEDESVAEREVAAHNLVKHDYVLKLIEYDKHGIAGSYSTSIMYVVLPYFERGTLLQELDRRGRSLRHFRPIEILEMFLKICEGVKAFHDCDPPLAHRDLKTGNILLDNADCPIIMDLAYLDKFTKAGTISLGFWLYSFGANIYHQMIRSVAPARVQISNAAEGQALQDLASERCSMPYRAPELFHVEPNSLIDERTDIWSLGCILYALCFFKSPFDAVYERGDSVALAVISGNIYFQEGQVYGDEMEELIRFMLTVNPVERPFIESVVEKTNMALANAKSQADHPSV